MYMISIVQRKNAYLSHFRLFTGTVRQCTDAQIAQSIARLPQRLATLLHGSNRTGDVKKKMLVGCHLLSHSGLTEC